ncbi:acyltransferase family protein [Roseateles paludis]|uniref:Acyltransferase family protein n=1 Tax=Roseateles paludis TaxID=3145238 RepID=A0ABV0G006_9BURK
MKAVGHDAGAPEGRSGLTRLGYRADVQGLRALAVALVVAFHAGVPLPGGFVGVDVFFVISGFVITGMLLREWRDIGHLDLRRFYVRRFFRLVPPLAVMIAITLIVSALLLSPSGTQQAVSGTAVGALLFSANIAIARLSGDYFATAANLNPLLHTWSLSVEEQFYILFPALLYALLRGMRGVRTGPLAAVLAGIGLLSLLLTVAPPATSGQPVLHWLAGFYSPFTRSWEFLVGALLALPLALWRQCSQRASTALGLVGLACLLVSVFQITESTRFPGWWTLLPTVGTALMLLAGCHANGWVTRWLSARSLALVGDWSYSIYLWHWPAIVFAKLLWPDSGVALGLAVLLACVVAVLSYYGVERPMRTAYQSRSSNVLQPILVMQAAPMLLAVGLATAAYTWFGNLELKRSMQTVSELPTGWGPGDCGARLPVERKQLERCRLLPSATGRPIYLVGDSNAMHFSDGLAAAAEKLNRPVITLTMGGCPFADATLVLSGKPEFSAECRVAFESHRQWLQRQPAGTVIVGMVSRYWSDESYQVLTAGLPAGSSRAAQMDAGVEHAVRAMQDAGHQVVLVQTIPHFVAADYPMVDGQCPGWRVITRRCAVASGRMPRTFADTYQAFSRHGLEAASTRTGAVLADFRDYFCPDTRCRTDAADGTPMYMADGYHLNRSGSRMLGPQFLRLLERD